MKQNMSERERRIRAQKRAEAKRRMVQKKKRQKIFAVSLTSVAVLLLIALMPMAFNALISQGLANAISGQNSADPLAALPRQTSGMIPLSVAPAKSTQSPATAPKPTPSPTATPKPTPAPTPTPQPGRTIDPAGKMVAFTFDDGPSKYTLRILEAFEKVDGRATFFELGSLVDERPELTQQVAEAGHQIGSHTYDHTSLRKVDAKTMLNQVNSAADAIERAATDTEVTLLRPPYGNVNDLMRETIPMPFILWDVDTLDWKTRNTKKIIAETNKYLKDGSIVLMHDIYETTAAAVEKLLPALKKKGYQFVTIDELFEAKGIQLENGKSYFSARPQNDGN